MDYRIWYEMDGAENVCVILDCPTIERAIEIFWSEYQPECKITAMYRLAGDAWREIECPVFKAADYD